MVSKVDGTSLLLYANIETLFSYAIPVTKQYGMLTSANGLIPLQSKMAQYANVFRLYKKAKEEDLPCTRKSSLLVLELLTSLTNTLTEIGHSLDRICSESMTTLGVEYYFKGTAT